MINSYQSVKTSIGTLDCNENFKLCLTYYEGGKKPLLLGMHLSHKDSYATASPQISNYMRSVFRKFGNGFLSKIAPNDYFSIDQRKIENETHQSLYCKFIKDEKVHLDIADAHAITQAWDQLMNNYDLSRLFSSGQILFTTKGPNGLIQRFSESRESDKQVSLPKLPEGIGQFLLDIVETERT